MDRLTYVLPLRWPDDADLDDLTGYLRRIANDAEVIVVDGSPDNAFVRHSRAWGRFVRHVRPDPAHVSQMGKVAGVLTGVDLASNDAVVIADDDVRYDRPTLARMADLLVHADLVWPQNYFDPLPWHALWDTGRTLINRALGHDFPGTLGVRRKALLAAGGYDGNVMFENLELRRTIDVAGGLVETPLDLYVRRSPPTTKHFLSQRVRQAYDDLALPGRLGVFLAVAPLAAGAIARRRMKWLAAGVAAIVGIAEFGRRRAGGPAVFPARASLFAPLWVVERSVTSWIALWERFARGGVRYGDGRIRSAASSYRTLRRRVPTVQEPEERARRICSA